MARNNGKWFSFRGVDCREIGVTVVCLPDRPRPAMRGKRVEIPGRDGSFILPDGGYDDVALRIDCRAADADAASALFTGSGDLVLSDDPDRCYRARAAAQYAYRAPVGGKRAFTLEFAAQPFRYRARPESDQILLTGSSGFLTNPGTVASEPVITVYGNGDMNLVLGGSIVQLYGVDTAITIDSRIGDAYAGGQLLNGRMAGEFPRIPPGQSAWSASGNISRIEIAPGWRWL